MEGWIKLHRKLRQKGWYLHSSKVHLWIELLLRASHNETEYMFRGQNIKLKPGQFVTGRKSLAESTGLSESCVERALTFFEKSEQQIEQQKSNKNRLITILSWHEYQTSEQHIGQQADNKRTTSGQQADTIKNEKKEKKDKNVKKKKYAEFVFLTKDEYNKLAEKHGDYWTKKMIDALDNYKGAKGKAYKSDYRAILSWVEDKIKNSPDYGRWRTKKAKDEARIRAEKEAAAMDELRKRNPKIDLINKGDEEIL